MDPLDTLNRKRLVYRDQAEMAFATAEELLAENPASYSGEIALQRSIAASMLAESFRLALRDHLG